MELTSRRSARTAGIMRIQRRNRNCCRKPERGDGVPSGRCPPSASIALLLALLLALIAAPGRLFAADLTADDILRLSMDSKRARNRCAVSMFGMSTSSY